MKLSENIKNLRKERGLTQEQLAEVLGVTAASISKWETSQTQPDLLLLAELAEYFAVSVDALMGHTIPADRIAALSQQMKMLEQAGETEQAEALAEKQVLSNVEDKAEFLLMVLSQMEDAHLLEVAKQALRQNVKKCCNSL